jgi:ribonuclease HI
MANKFYAVKVGKVPGIYTNWNECKEQVHGFKGAIYKSFDLEEDAKSYMNNEEKVEKKVELIPEKDEVFAFVDGSFNKKTFEYAYGIVLIDTNNEKLTFSGKDNKPEVVNMRNVAGELKGAMFITHYVVKNMPEIKRIRIFHDYEGIAKWVTGDWGANLEYTQKYRDFMHSMKNKIEISFEKVTAHTGVTYNEEADKLAKTVLGIK